MCYVIHLSGQMFYNFISFPNFIVAMKGMLRGKYCMQTIYLVPTTHKSYEMDVLNMEISDMAVMLFEFNHKINKYIGNIHSVPVK